MLFSFSSTMSTHLTDLSDIILCHSEAKRLDSIVVYTLTS